MEKQRGFFCSTVITGEQKTYKQKKTLHWFETNAKDVRDHYLISTRSGNPFREPLSET